VWWGEGRQVWWGEGGQVWWGDRGTMAGCDTGRGCQAVLLLRRAVTSTPTHLLRLIPAAVLRSPVAVRRAAAGRLTQPLW
jgi:hypothetical protein